MRWREKTNAEPHATMTTKTHLSGDNILFLEQLYAQYIEDKSSVDPSWIPFFSEYFGATAPVSAPSFQARSIFAPVAAPATNGHANGQTNGHADHDRYDDHHDGTWVQIWGKGIGFAASVEALVRAHRLHGHTAAALDPLSHEAQVVPVELDPSKYGIMAADMGTRLKYEALFGDREVTLTELLEKLRSLYCGSIGVEYQHISDTASRRWLRSAIEGHDYAELDGATERKHALLGLLDADAFESFLHKKYVGAKRFSLTGGDALIPMIRGMLDEAGKLGVKEVLIGMAHRGRLNVLRNIMGKPAENMLSEFEKSPTPEKYIGSSDVKYHMGYSSDYTTRYNHAIHLSLAFNPSHLEFVNPVVVGRARAKQRRLGTEDAERAIVPLLLHGDAAFSGQGIVPEGLNMSMLDAYRVGGTVHIVINNQVGFTTGVADARSTRYATDIAKMLEVPILHVNGDDTEACLRVIKLAMRYRQEFGRDVVIDLVCYRRYGHNEGDEPRFTQPVMYQKVDDMTPVREKYAAELVKDGVISAEEVERLWSERQEFYGAVYDKVHNAPIAKKVQSGSGLWERFRGGALEDQFAPTTRMTRDKLIELGLKLSVLPEGFEANRTVQRMLKGREAMATGEQPMDWGFGEGMGFASLLAEGTHVRLTGQDCIRGTFSHRHAAIFDSRDGHKWWPARHLGEDQGLYEVYNSHLSESAVMGFEYGYSLDSPDSLILWEAQFGDFANGAQVIIDQFISAGEDKWQRLSGLVLLLPHGYEGQGPEHSSARLERFLQLCAEDNMFVCNLTTPAQYFHALRRQVHMQARKPMIIMSPKSLLRLKEATSTLDDLANFDFQPILPEARPLDPSKVTRVLLCSGKVYYDLIAHANETGAEDTAILRVEQLYPLDTRTLTTLLAPYTNLADVRWVQEEPKNMGSWSYIFPLLLEHFGKDLMPRYVGRAPSASPATGDHSAHEIEQRMLIREAFAV
jgi:2-oxoglutarate dehydrogenase E1 component